MTLPKSLPTFLLLQHHLRDAGFLTAPARGPLFPGFLRIRVSRNIDALTCGQYCIRFYSIQARHLIRRSIVSQSDPGRGIARKCMHGDQVTSSYRGCIRAPVRVSHVVHRAWRQYHLASCLQIETGIPRLQQSRAGTSARSERSPIFSTGNGKNTSILPPIRRNTLQQSDK